MLLRYTSDGLLWGGDERPHSTGEERYRRGTQAVLGRVASPLVLGCAQDSLCSVDGLRGRLDIFGQVGAQPIIVMLQMFDHALKVAHPRPQSSALQNETIIPIHPLTQ